MLEQMPPGAVKIKWMPAHCDDAARREVLKRALDNGTISHTDVEGNANVDRLAQEGREMRQEPQEEKWARIDRRYVARLVHAHLLSAWKHFQNHTLVTVEGETSTSAPNAAEAEEVLEMESLDNLMMQWDDPLDEEGDAFGAIGLDGPEFPSCANAAGPAANNPAPASSGAASSSSGDGGIVDAFPTYPLSGDVQTGPHGHRISGNIPFTNLVNTRVKVQNAALIDEVRESTRRAGELGRKVKVTNAVAVMVSVPFELWACILEWICNVEWSVHADQCCPRAGGVCSWHELALAISVHAGFNFCKWDLTDAAALCAAALRKLNQQAVALGMSKFPIENKCATALTLVGHRLSEIACRPRLPKEVWINVAQQMRDAAS